MPVPTICVMRNMDKGDSEQFLSVRNSFCTSKSNNLSNIRYKSDVNVGRQRQLITNDVKQIEIHNLLSFREYYKNYEHDALPVKDLTATSDSTDKASLTNSDIDKIEMNILKNTSQELEMHKNTISNLESHINFFKITVQEIFDNFYTSMRDFELYKKRFHEILEKNQEEAIADMDDFIKDTIQHIMSSESSISNGISPSNIKTNSTKTLHNNKRTDEESIISTSDENNKEIHIKNLEEINARTFNVKSFDGSLQGVVEAYKNYDYTTDSTMDDNKTVKLNSDMKDEVLNIYLLSRAPCVQIKMTDRNLLSEINIKEPSNRFDDSKYVASAENLKKLAAKKKELEKYVQQERNDNIGSDEDIPVKVSYAKRNIHLSEEFTNYHETEKSFISKLCNFICKKFRKS